MTAPPARHVAPPRVVESYADLACDLAGDYGLVADDWQADVLHDWLAVDGTGRFAALKCGLSCPRQNGKNGALEIRELFGLVGRGEKILHTAHQVKTAQKHWRRMRHFFGRKVGDPNAKFPELNALVVEMRNVNGQELILLANGGSLELIARSQGSGRGFTVDTIVCDEAQDMSDDDLEALLSTSSAGPRGDPQWIFTGTPPGPKADGEVFTRNRNEALEAAKKPPSKRPKLVWHEWSATRTDPIDERATWEKANPGLVTGRLLVDVIEAELGTYSVGGFQRERLGIWPEDPSLNRVIPAKVWDALVSAGPPDGTPPTAIGVDMSHDRVLAIGACWIVDNVHGRSEDDSAAAADGTEGAPADTASDTPRCHVEVVALDYATDTLAAHDWLLKRARPKRIPVVIDAMSPAASMLPALKNANVRVQQTSSTDMAKACGLFYDDAMAGRLSHGVTVMTGPDSSADTGAGRDELSVISAGKNTDAVSQKALDDALAGAKKRAIGTAGGWAWDRKDPAVNLAPLVAVTLARYGASTRKRRTSTKRIPVKRKVVIG